jgi:hypothetical protein
VISIERTHLDIAAGLWEQDREVTVTLLGQGARLPAGADLECADALTRGAQPCDHDRGLALARRSCSKSRRRRVALRGVRRSAHSQVWTSAAQSCEPQGQKRQHTKESRRDGTQRANPWIKAGDGAGDVRM